MTGDDLKAKRKEAKLTRPEMGELAGLHPDTVKYHERKARIALGGYGPRRILKVLGLDEWRARQVAKETEFRMARLPPAGYGVFYDTSAPAPARHGVLTGNDSTGVLTRGDKTCGAKTRAGHPCKSRVLLKSGRCKNHGGKSTWPNTPEGRERIAEAQRRRWATSRGSDNALTLP